jgi:hypothetical protein
VEANHEFIYLLLGKKAALPYSNSWSEILSVKSFTNVIDVSLKFLFGWTMENVSLMFLIVFSYLGSSFCIGLSYVVPDPLQPQVELVLPFVFVLVREGGCALVSDHARWWKIADVR